MKIGFGTYRVARGVFAQEQALSYALDNGITIIDTSTNYTGGLSELLVGDVIQKYDRDSIEIISKFGYIQGELLVKVKADEEVKDLVRYTDDCYHSIDADFMRQQLDASLMRLQTDYIDTYLLHNPEYFLMAHIKELSDKERYQNQMLERIYSAFVALEEEVAKGRIRAYGISSNSFSLHEDALHFLPYKDLVDIAQKAALSMGHEKHHFTTVQLPINLLEVEGLSCARWAKAQSLRVIANRPLNAFKDNLMYRLATYERPTAYEALLNETLLFLEDQDLDVIATIISELDTIVHRFGWIGEYEEFLMRQVMPNLQKHFTAIAQEDQATIAASLEKFFEVYADMVKYECGRRTLTSLKTLGIEASEPIQEFALKFLSDESSIDVVLLGMRKVKYVQDALTMSNSLLSIKG